MVKVDFDIRTAESMVKVRLASTLITQVRCDTPYMTPELVETFKAAEQAVSAMREAVEAHRDPHTLAEVLKGG